MPSYDTAAPAAFGRTAGGSTTARDADTQASCWYAVTPHADESVRLGLLSFARMIQPDAAGQHPPSRVVAQSVGERIGSPRLREQIPLA